MNVSMLLRIDEIGEIFEDVTPVPQNDGPDGGVCAISYPTSFILAYDYMRACWKSGELSPRSLKLSATCLKLNPANYTVWHYRRQCLESLGYLDVSTAAADDFSNSTAKARIQEDLTLAAQLGGSNPKNYQIWYHRRALLDDFHQKTKTIVLGEDAAVSSSSALETAFLETELAYIADVLEEDSKNYHAWSHRQWLIRTVNQPAVWDRELEYVHKLIQQDPRNNSAWNQRWFAAHRAVEQPLSIELCRREAEFALAGARLDPYNESPFRFLIGLLREQQKVANDMATSLYKEYYSSVEAMRLILQDAQRDPEACVNWTSARIDLLEGIHDDEEEESSLTKASALATGMAEQYDTIRQKYWKLRVRQLEEKKSSLNKNRTAA